MDKKLSKINSGIDKLFCFLEKDRFTPLTALIYFVALGLIRSLSESLIFEYGTFSFYLIVQHTAFNFPVFVLGVLVIYKATNIQYRKVLNLVLLGMFIVIIPPFVDKFIWGLQGVELGYMYNYYDPSLTFLEKLTTIFPTYLFGKESVSPGLKLMAFSLSAMSTFYIFYRLEIYRLKTYILNKDYRVIFEKMVRLFFGSFGIWVVVWFISSIVPSIILFAEGGEVRIFDYIYFTPKAVYYEFFNLHGYSYAEIFPQNPNVVGLAEGLALQQRSLYITMFFVSLTGISLFGSIYTVNKSLCNKIYKSLHKQFIFTTTISSLLGSGLIYIVDPNFKRGWAIDSTYVLHFPYIFYLGSIGFFIGCFGSFIHAYSNEGSLLNDYFSKQLSIVSLLAVLSFALLMGPFSTLPFALLAIIITYLIFSNFDGRFDLIKSIALGINSILLFFVGFYTPGVWKSTIWNPITSSPVVETYKTVNINRRPDLTLEVVYFIVILFVMISFTYYISTLLKKSNKHVRYPKTFLYLPLFLLPILVFRDLIYFTILVVLGLMAVFLMDKNHPNLPIFIINFQFIFILLSHDIWGIIPYLGI